MLSGIDLFKDLHEHKGVLEQTRSSVLSMDRIANTLGMVDGDKVYFDDITGIDIEAQDRSTVANQCGNQDFSCLGNDRAEMELNKIIDETYILKTCRVNRLASLSGEQANTIIGSAVAKFDHNQMILEAKNHLEVTSDALNVFTPDPLDTGIYEKIESMITKVETDNATSLKSINRGMDIVVVVSPAKASEIRKQKLGCCELLGGDLSAIENAWGAKDVVVAPANVMPAGDAVMVYVIDWSLFGYACLTKTVFDGMSEATRNYKVMQLFEEFGSKMLTATDFAELIQNPGEKLLEGA